MSTEREGGGDRPLSRRELRALREGRGADEAAHVEPEEASVQDDRSAAHPDAPASDPSAAAPHDRRSGTVSRVPLGDSDEPRDAGRVRTVGDEAARGAELAAAHASAADSSAPDEPASPRTPVEGDVDERGAAGSRQAASDGGGREPGTPSGWERVGVESASAAGGAEPSAARTAPRPAELPVAAGRPSGSVPENPPTENDADVDGAAVAGAGVSAMRSSAAQTATSDHPARSRSDGPAAGDARSVAPRPAGTVRVSEPSPPAAEPRRRIGRFAGAMLAVLAVLVVLGGAGAAVSLLQGPRLSTVQVDPAAAIETSGSRVVLTANQALTPITPEQVTVTPSVPFTVDAAGRMVGVRFTVPLDDDTEYTVSVAGARSVGGGTSAALETSFRTPLAELFLLQRDPQGDDRIFRTGLSGKEAVPVFSHAEIDDFRATSTSLVVSVREGETSAVYVTDLDGGNPVPLSLPGDGTVTALQVSDRGDLVGYTFTDSELTETSGRASVLFTSSLRHPDAEPKPMTVDGKEPSIARWRFVPDSSALLFIDFAGDLIVFDPEAENPEPGRLGTAFDIDAVSRGTYTAFVTHADSSVVGLDLTTGDETPLVEPDADLGEPASVLPVPGGGTVRQFVRYGDDGMPEAQVVAFVDDDGASSPLLEAVGTDALQQVCVSPSGRYVAALVAPDLASNPYDRAPQPLPVKLETRIVEIETGEQVSALNGFDVSWCEVGPW